MLSSSPGCELSSTPKLHPSSLSASSESLSTLFAPSALELASSSGSHSAKLLETRLFHAYSQTNFTAPHSFLLLLSSCFDFNFLNQLLKCLGELYEDHSLDFKNILASSCVAIIVCWLSFCFIS